MTAQREQLSQHARQNTLYDDGHAKAARGKTGHLKERRRLESDIRGGKIAIILMVELSRLSRNDTMQGYIAWLTLCADHNVKLATLTRVLDSGQNSDSVLLITLRNELNQIDSATQEEPNWDALTFNREELETLNQKKNRNLVDLTIEEITLYSNYPTIKYLFPYNKTIQMR